MCRLRKRGLLATVVLLGSTLIGTPSFASDWGGPYVGLSLGMRTMDVDWHTTQHYDPIGNPISDSSNDKATFSSSDFRGGIYAGYNWQVSPQWIVGVDGAIGSANNRDKIKDRIPGMGIAGSTPSSYAEVEAENDMRLVFRGGYLVTADTLIYGMLGISKVDIEETVTCPADTNVCNPAVGTQSFSKKKSLDGTAIGLGVERNLQIFGSDWVARAEYQVSSYDEYKFEAMPYSVSTFGADAEIDASTKTVSVGLAYQF